MDFIAILIQIVVGIIVIAPILWLVGRALAGKDKAKFTDAIWIVVLGTIIGAVVGGLSGQFDISNYNVRRLACIDKALL